MSNPNPMVIAIVLVIISSTERPFYWCRLDIDRPSTYALVKNGERLAHLANPTCRDQPSDYFLLS